MRKGHCQSDQHWTYFKGNTREASERWGEAHMGYPKHIDTILNWTQLNCSCSCAGWKECMGGGLQFFECWRVWRWRSKPDLRQLLFFPCRPLVRFMSVSSVTQMPIPHTVAPSAAAFMTWAPHCGTRWMFGVAPTPSAVASERPSKPWPTVAWAWPVRHGGWVGGC